MVESYSCPNLKKFSIFSFKARSNLKLRRNDYDYYDDYGDYDYDNGYDYDRRYPREQYDDRRGYDRQNKAYKRPPPKKSGSSGGAIASVAIRIILIIAILLFFTLPQFESQREYVFDILMAGLYKYQEIPDSAEFSVERTFTIESDGELNYTLFLPIPQNLIIDGEDAQTLKSIEWDPEYTETRDTDDNEEYDQWVWKGSMETGRTDTITVKYHFKTAKIKWDISIGKSGTIAEIPKRVLNRYGGDQWPVADYQDSDEDDQDNDDVPDDEDVDDDNDGKIEKYRIEPSNPEIRELLIDILNDEKLYSGNDLTKIGSLNVYEVVAAIYEHIEINCAYPNEQQKYQDAQKYGNYPKWATGTWDDRLGDCDDQSILFISLCRAAGIPAMLEIGALYDPNMDRWEGHGWANVYIPYKEKYHEEKGRDHVTPMVDIVNDIFLFRDPNRFSEWVDDGVTGYIDPETHEWEISHLEQRYLAWEYIRGDPSVDVNIKEEYDTLEFKAYPPDQKLYI